MPSAAKEACWICGTLTLNRCGACEKAGIDIFCCSRECQKLVWPVHKLVCGPDKANPFLHPPMSEEEAKDMKAHFDDRFEVKDTSGGRNWTSMRKYLCERAVQFREPHLPDAFLASQGKLPHCPVEHPHAQDILAQLRGADYLRLNFYKPQPEVPLSRISYAQMCTILWTFLPIGMSVIRPVWWSELHHRSLCFFHLERSLRHAPCDSYLETVLFCSMRWTYSALKGFLLKEVAKTHPVEAKKMAAGFTHAVEYLDKLEARDST